VLGFHGCDESVASGIFHGKMNHLDASQNQYDWLGAGIYFWESSPARAMEYARLRRKYPASKARQIKKPAVVGAVIDLGNCLDLLDSQFFEMIREGYADLNHYMQAAGLPMPFNRPLHASHDLLLRDLDCHVINTIHRTRARKNLPAFDSVRAAFIEGKPLYPGASFFDKNHIQICVCNPHCIKGYFRPMSLKSSH
jgi:hypothetical protein